ncbi:glycosyltransferase family 39 protein [Sideroxydans sp. CL21]|uniref:glycosyltransferase family 39 protein n=1 Tax=Sideroxydans sp. CL21 TaxID=2600596 RepID=UPI0012A91FFA|nr:glycosyltransferase family 39 protein [Sideroxydans sp. CL21]VVC83433.1 Undecaprenyl phosphate-alpha-4-amino-4-deoxy-L-arabinose arabinosyl transferase (EC 2.4.2.43) @ Melittin resistance protein PqaB @ Polymyxin resistance protein PmrK [Sideroxydans sp. CL21]
MTNDISRRGLLLLLLAVVLIWFGNLEYRKLIRPDEGRYAEIPREMVVSGDWTTPRLNELKYFEKPPLQYWATAVAYEVFGEHQWTSRIWAALTGFAGILLAWFTGARLFGREAGIYAALLLGSSMLYAMMSHINTLDMGVTFFISLGLFSLLLAQKEDQVAVRRNWMLLAWAGLALAVLSKGLMGLVLPGAALFLYSVFNRDITVWKRMHWFSGLLLFSLIAVPWFVLVIKANPEFFQRFFIYEHFERFTTKVHGRFQPWYYFVPILLLGMMPWTMLMFDTLLRSWRGSVRKVKVFSPERFLLVWAVFVYLFFSVSDSKLPSYLLPIFPALALLMGKQLAEMKARRLFWLTIPSLVVVAILLGLAPFADRTADTPLQHQMYSEYSVWLVIAAAFWLVSVIAALWLLRRDSKMIAVVVLAFSSLIAAQAGVSGYNTIARERSSYIIADAIKPLIKPDVPFYSVFCYEQTLPFYLKRTFTLVDYQDEMDFGIKMEPERWIPSVELLAKRWSAQAEAYAIVPTPLLYILQQQGIAMKEIYRDEQYVVVSKP